MSEISKPVRETAYPKSQSEVAPPQSAGASVTGAVAAADEGFKHTIGWNEAEYGYVNTAFQAAYAIGLLVVGRLMDRFGTRKGFSFAITFWSVAAMCHALARSAFGFGTARFFLGLGEAGNFPASIKTVAEWFPKKERALATGVFNSGSNVGAIVAPLAVPWIAVTYGWQLAFIVTGALGFIWIVAWWFFYEVPTRHRRVNSSELAYITSDAASTTEPITEESTTYYPIFANKAIWGFMGGKLLTDPIWWF